MAGTHDEVLAGLWCGEIDLLQVALRFPAPIDDVVQERLFDDSLVLLAGVSHPLRQGGVTLQALAAYPWLVPRQGTPSRSPFDAIFADRGLGLPVGLTETGSVILMREMLGAGHHLACISHAQARGELARGLVHALDFTIPGAARSIGLTLRQGWHPTPAQADLLSAICTEIPAL